MVQDIQTARDTINEFGIEVGETFAYGPERLMKMEIVGVAEESGAGARAYNVEISGNGNTVEDTKTVTDLARAVQTNLLGEHE